MSIEIVISSSAGVPKADNVQPGNGQPRNIVQPANLRFGMNDPRHGPNLGVGIAGVNLGFGIRPPNGRMEQVPPRYIVDGRVIQVQRIPPVQPPNLPIVRPQNMRPQNVRQQNVRQQNVRPQIVRPQNVRPPNVRPPNVRPPNVSMEQVPQRYIVDGRVIQVQRNPPVQPPNVRIVRPPNFPMEQGPQRVVVNRQFIQMIRNPLRQQLNVRPPNLPIVQPPNIPLQPPQNNQRPVQRAENQRYPPENKPPHQNIRRT